VLEEKAVEKTDILMVIQFGEELQRGPNGPERRGEEDRSNVDEDARGPAPRS
jgi:hypothetical protein